MSDRPPTESVGRRGVIKTSALAISGITGLSAGGGLGAAEEGETDDEDEFESESDEETCFPSKLEIEVKPGNSGQQDPINPNSKGVVPVAVLQTEAFDPTERTVEYRFDAAEKVGCDSAGPGRSNLPRLSIDGRTTDRNWRDAAVTVRKFVVSDTIGDI